MLKYIFLTLVIVNTAGALDLQPGGHPALPNMSFPLVIPSTKLPISLGMCVDGSESLFVKYDALNLSPVFVYDLPNIDSQGHVWVAVPDGDKWLAVDSYWGPMTSPSYYKADGICSNMTMLQAAFPREPA